MEERHTPLCAGKPLAGVRRWQERLSRQQRLLSEDTHGNSPLGIPKGDTTTFYCVDFTISRKRMRHRPHFQDAEMKQMNEDLVRFNSHKLET